MLHPSIILKPSAVGEDDNLVKSQLYRVLETGKKAPLNRRLTPQEGALCDALSGCLVQLLTDKMSFNGRSSAKLCHLTAHAKHTSLIADVSKLNFETSVGLHDRTLSAKNDYLRNQWSPLARTKSR
jgi:hypothetical protein